MVGYIIGFVFQFQRPIFILTDSHLFLSPWPLHVPCPFSTPAHINFRLLPAKSKKKICFSNVCVNCQISTLVEYILCVYIYIYIFCSVYKYCMDTMTTKPQIGCPAKKTKRKKKTMPMMMMMIIFSGEYYTLFC